MVCPECENSGSIAGQECEECRGYGVVCDLCGYPVDYPDTDICYRCELEITADPMGETAWGVGDDETAEDLKP